MRRIKSSNIRKRVRRMGYRPPFQMNRMKWEFHSYDVDPFPSIPHGHSVSSVHKLQVYSGEVYNGKKVCGKIKKKEFDRLWSDPRFNEYVKIAKKFHENNNKKGHRWRMARRSSTVFTFICEVEMNNSEGE